MQQQCRKCHAYYYYPITVKCGYHNTKYFKSQNININNKSCLYAPVLNTLESINDYNLVYNLKHDFCNIIRDNKNIRFKSIKRYISSKESKIETKYYRL